MWKFEQTKLFMSGDIQELEKQYNLWVRQETGRRKKIPTIAETPLVVLDRSLCVRNYEGEETYVLAVFYEHYDVKVTAEGKDRGAHFKGGSAFGPK